MSNKKRSGYFYPVYVESVPNSYILHTAKAHMHQSRFG